MVQANTLIPTGNPVIALFGLFGDTMVPPPLTTVQVPTALATGLLAAMEMLLTGVQIS
jgi:hypothetical protein